MKKIGILSMQRVKNYGSFLQAFALKRILEDISQAKVEFVDFESKNGVVEIAKDSLEMLKKNKARYFLLYVIYKLSYHAVRFGKITNKKIVDVVNLFDFYRLYCYRFEKNFWPILNVTNKQNLRANVDLLVIGSDEVFNHCEAQKAGYSDELFGLNSNARRLVSFAASFGCTKLSDLQNAGYYSKIQKYLEKFDAISVRDRNSQKIVNTMTGLECAYHLDPVLHFDYSKYMPVITVKKPFIAVYAYSGLGKIFSDEIKRYARENNLEILCFMGYQGSLGKFMNVSPFELLSYMQQASCIITTTFHGSVFALKFNKPFCAIVQHRVGSGYGNDEKLGDLLKRVGLEKHMIDDPSKIPDTICTKIAYNQVNDYIQASVQDGISYLKNQVAAI